MLLDAQLLALAALFSNLVTGRPLDSAPRDIIPRDKSYVVVNVGGDSSTQAPSTTTSVIKTTKTVHVINPGETVTQEVTATVIRPHPVPAPTTSSSSSSSTTCTSSTAKSSSSASLTPVSSTSTSSSWMSTSTSTSTHTPSSSPLPSTSTAASTTSSLTSSSTSTSIETPKPIFITVTVSNDDGPTQYYDDGMWHTYYRVKTFEAVAATPSPVA
ncbi:hypothetical protein BDW02DRAFT_566217 [Decorospora gaudefroyi]|uniref:REJ domain-containing protein n=1 Tax=Decorospora gaudefroyi TaxID=184978 RepID=A0A6A5KNA3_9PLEO|nr:hypothetical protein BDW02DRAFT_566217 [Decorospora gaudefroyi]